MSINKFIDLIKEAQREAIKERIRANAIFINTNLVKVPELFIGDGILPPMICGLEVHLTPKDLPDNFSFAILEGSTKRDEFASKIREETAREILQELFSEAISNISETVELTTFQIEQMANRYGVEVEE